MSASLLGRPAKVRAASVASNARAHQFSIAIERAEAAKLEKPRRPKRSAAPGPRKQVAGRLACDESNSNLPARGAQAETGGACKQRREQFFNKRPPRPLWARHARPTTRPIGGHLIEWAERARGAHLRSSGGAAQFAQFASAAVCSLARCKCSTRTPSASHSARFGRKREREREKSRRPAAESQARTIN